MAFLARHDSDLFNRADAFEKLTLQMVDQFITDLSRRGAQNAMPSESYLFAFEDILNDDSLSPAYRAKVLEMPSENYIAENRVLIEPALIREACDLIKRRIGQRLRGSFEDKIKNNQTPGLYRPDAADAGRRALKLLSLSYLAYAQDAKAMQQVRNLYKNANNLTDRLGAVNIAVQASLPIGEELLSKADVEWKSEPLLNNKWLALSTQLRTQRGASDRGFNSCPDSASEVSGSQPEQHLRPARHILPYRRSGIPSS